LNVIPSGEEVGGIAFSKDGEKMVVSKGPFGGAKSLWEIMIDPEGVQLVGDLKPITPFATSDYVECALSLENKLAFTAREVERNLWTFTLDTDSALGEGTYQELTWGKKNNYYPALSSDGERLTWTSHQAGSGMLYFRDSLGAEPKKVTREWGREVREIGACFSLEADKLIYSSTLGGSYEIYRTPSPGSVSTQLTETANRVRDVHPTFSSKTNSIYFYSNRFGNWDIWRVPISGGSPAEPVTTWPSNELYPGCSSDGKYLAFSSDQNGSFDIWLVDLENGESRAIDTHPATDVWPAWAPEGNRIYFTSDRSGVFNIWTIRVDGGDLRQITNFDGLTSGLPETALYTKFALSDTRLVFPLEIRQGEIYILEALGDE
jgi:Tol biopolymer transport system component